MRPKSNTPETPSERLVRDIRRATRKQYSAEEKIRIVLDGLRGEVTTAELCRREGIAESLPYSWSKQFLEAGKHSLRQQIGKFHILQYIALSALPATPAFALARYWMGAHL